MDHYRRSTRNLFTACPIDRVSGQRRDAQWLAARLEDETTRFIPVWRSRNLFAGDQALEPVTLSPGEVRDHVHTVESTILLGEQEGRATFGIGLSTQDALPPSGLAELGEFHDLRHVAATLDGRDAALLAYARAMVYWHDRYRFCGDCGSPTTSAEGGHMRVCSNDLCAQKHFPRTDPAIIVLVTSGERCLLGRKSVWPEGQYSTIAGFVEPGESIEDAVLREVCEETGVRVDEMHYHSSQPWPFPSSLMLGFTARATSEEIRIDGDELEHARWFTRKDMESKLRGGTLRLPPSISISYRLIEGWFDAGDLGPLREVHRLEG